MTEIEQLKADLETMEKALDFLKRHECPNVALGVKSICDLIKKNIADLEAQQEQANEWEEAKKVLRNWGELTAIPNISQSIDVLRYARHLEAKVAELESATIRTVEQNREKLAELTTILNAIPPACGEAMELVKKRIESVKKEMQGNG